MVKFKFWLLLSAICTTTSLFSQSVVGEWKSYTSTLNIRSIVQQDNYIYGASGGGLVQFDTIHHLFNRFGMADGLTNLDIASIAEDKFGHLWLGMNAPKGEINIWDTDSEDIKKSFGEHIFGEQLTAITGFTFQSDQAFVICQRNVDWGVLEFIVKDGEYFYKDFYFNLPLEIDRINRVQIIGDTLYLATDKGLIYANYKTKNLKQMPSWKTITKDQSEVCKIILHAGQVIANFGSLLYIVNGDQTELFNDTFKRPVQDIISTPGSELIIASPTGLFQLQSDGSWLLRNHESLLTLQSDTSGNFWGGTEDKGLCYCDSLSVTYYTPNTLLSNICTALNVDNQGNLFTATLDGLSLLIDRGWYNIVKSDYTVHISGQDRENQDYFFADTIAFNISSRIYDLVKRGDGEYFATLYGSLISRGKKGGVLRLNLNNLAQYTVYDTTNGAIAATSGRGGSDYYLAPYCATIDQQDNLWIGVQYAQNDEVLAVLTPDDQWVHFSIQESRGYLNHFVNTITFDSQGRVWISSEVHSEDPFSSGGIIVLDYNHTLADKTDDQWYLVTQSDGLANNSVFSIAFDREETLWVMSSGGIQQAVVSDDFSGRFFKQIQIPVFSNLSFSKECRIKVDGRDNKWFTTVDAGVKVYTFEGLWLNSGAGITTQNSAILSDEVFDIAFYAPQGLIYFATKKGISVYKSPYAVIGPTYNKLKIFPLPYTVPNTESLVIDGMLPGSEVKITTLNGIFIRHLSVEKNAVVGSQAFWDGKDYRGNYVSSGVYLCLAYDREGHHRVAKIAVLRK